MDPDLDLYDALASGNTDLLTFFYHLLWKTGTSGGGGGAVKAPVSSSNGRVPVQIPDTVVLHHSRVLAWYFTAKDGSIKRKSRKNLSTEAMLETLKSKGKSVSKCVGTLTRVNNAVEDGFDQRFATAKDLANIVSDDSSGVLQLFIDPKEHKSGQPSAQVVVASWTPNVFFVERRINSTKLDNEKIPLHDRCTLSDTSHHVRVAPLVSSRTTKLMEQQCLSAAQHIESVFRYRVLALDLHFCTDANDVPWLLRCTTLRVSHPTKLNMSVSATLTRSKFSTSPRLKDDEKEEKLRRQQRLRGGGGPHSGLGSPTGHKNNTGALKKTPSKYGGLETTELDNPTDEKELGLRRRRSTVFPGLMRHASTEDMRGAGADGDGDEVLSPGGSPPRRSTLLQLLAGNPLSPNPSNATSFRRPNHHEGSSEARHSVAFASSSGAVHEQSSEGESEETETEHPEGDGEEPQITCALCHTELTVNEDAQFSVEEFVDTMVKSEAKRQRELQRQCNFSTVPLKHVLFPLGVLEFYQSHPPSTFYQQIWNSGVDDVPPHVQLIFPNMLTKDYEVMRHDDEWLCQPIPLCESCSTGLWQLTEAIAVRADGAIQHPFGQGRTAPTLQRISQVTHQPIPSHARAASVSPERTPGKQQAPRHRHSSSITPSPTPSKFVSKTASAFNEDVSPYIGRRQLKARVTLPALDVSRRARLLESSGTGSNSSNLQKQRK